MKYHEVDALCPMSGIGEPPRAWEFCHNRCAWIDPETNECAVLRIVTMMQDLPLEWFNTLEVWRDERPPRNADVEKLARWQGVDVAALVDDLHGAGAIDGETIAEYSL